MARKILLADDSVTAQNMGRKILADAGYEVITVNNGSAALKKIAEHKPDLIVLDVYMPGYSGLEVCQRLKDAQETSRIPVLLTVGKLEPFKPEEARRVRAEGFIVKPFEASELLAALTKLEDKIVPRAEPSKPGRFARANAAIDEGRYDKSAGSEEDAGWKSRIGFPSKKKKPAEEEPDDSTIYNAVNKDLRTVVEQKATLPQPPQEEARVDLGALAPEGMPKDVTPEEIAALAAAAAQVKGKLAEDPVTASVPEPTIARPAETALPKESAVETAVPLAESKSEASQKLAELPSEIVSAPVPSPAEVTSAITALEPEASLSPETSGRRFESNATADRPADEPATMAMAAGAQFSGSSSRWTAVAVALPPEEAAISLENEMQKAYAAFAAADVAPAALVTLAPQIPPVPTDPAAAIETVSPVEAVTPELVGPVSMPPETVATQPESTLPTVTAMANSATEAISTAVREFEKVAASFFESKPAVPAEPEPTPVQVADPPSAQGFDAPPTIEAKPEEPVAQAVAWTREPALAEPAIPEVAKQDAPAPPIEPAREEQKTELEIEQKSEVQEAAEPKPEFRSEEPAAITAAAAEMTEATRVSVQPEIAPPAFVNESPVPETSFAQLSSETTDTAASTETSTTVKNDSGKETEIAETTAAAWASWRRIRESGDAKGVSPEPTQLPQEAEAEEPAPQHEAAMAVAAGAEKAPEEVPAAAEDSGEIASIVDSVLADMRPRIVEEISRKMRKK